MTQIIRKTWIPILIGLLFPAGSVLAQVHTDSIVGIDSIHVAQNLPVDSLNDTVAVAKSDSVPPRRNNALDDPVIYESKDSMVWNYGGYAYLYGNGKVTYQDVVLTSAIIKMQMDSSLVYADGVRDSSGKWEGTPVFMDGSTPYESNHISYNFKTEKGYINEIITQQGEGYMTSNEAKKGPEGEYVIDEAGAATVQEIYQFHCLSAS